VRSAPRKRREPRALPWKRDRIQIDFKPERCRASYHNPAAEIAPPAAPRAGEKVRYFGAVKRCLVIGLGNFGAGVAEALAERGHQVVAVDVDPARAERMAPLIRRVVVGDGTNAELLVEVGARDADLAVVSTGDDIPASVLAAVELRNCGVDEIHVKVISEIHARILDKVGVSSTIFPERESALLLARRLESRSILKYVDLGPGFSAQEMVVPERWIGRSLRQLELPRRYRAFVIAVHDHLADRMVAAPPPDDPLKESDTLLLAGTDEDLAKLVGKD
jgi:trk system potassium uptake protein TrkA